MTAYRTAAERVEDGVEKGPNAIWTYPTRPQPRPRYVGPPRFDAMVRACGYPETYDTLERQQNLIRAKAECILCQLRDDDLVDVVEWLQQRFPGRV